MVHSVDTHEAHTNDGKAHDGCCDDDDDMYPASIMVLVLPVGKATATPGDTTGTAVVVVVAVAPSCTRIDDRATCGG